MSSSDDLNEQFKLTLLEYQNTTKKYMDLMNSKNSDESNKLMILKNHTYNGTNLKNSNEENVNDCLNSCNNTVNCIGATYNNPNCTLITSNGNLNKNNGSSAIIRHLTFYSYKLKKLNSKLIDLNKQISLKTNNKYQDYQNDNNKYQQKNNIIQQNNQILENERNNINKMIGEFDTLNELQTEGELNVSMYYYNYIMLLLIAILLVIIFIKVSLQSSSQSGGNRFTFKGFKF